MVVNFREKLKRTAPVLAFVALAGAVLILTWTACGAKEDKEKRLISVEFMERYSEYGQLTFKEYCEKYPLKREMKPYHSNVYFLSLEEGRQLRYLAEKESGYTWEMEDEATPYALVCNLEYLFPGIPEEGLEISTFIDCLKDKGYDAEIGEKMEADTLHYPGGVYRKLFIKASGKGQDEEIVILITNRPFLFGEILTDTERLYPLTTVWMLLTSE